MGVFFPFRTHPQLQHSSMEKMVMSLLNILISNCPFSCCLQAGTPNLAAPFGANPLPSSVSLKTQASEHNVHDTFRYGYV